MGSAQLPTCAASQSVQMGLLRLLEATGNCAAYHRGSPTSSFHLAVPVLSVRAEVMVQPHAKAWIPPIYSIP